MSALIQHRIDRFGQVVILDIHSYNHRRDGPHFPAASSIDNPEMNMGTGSMPAYRWDTLLQVFLASLREARYQGEPLDVRENVRFKGGYFPQWVHATFPHNACAIAVEFKKSFMDEWSGKVNRQAMNQLGNALTTATESLMQELAHHIQKEHDPATLKLESAPIARMD
jgi:hypothetical protein